MERWMWRLFGKATIMVQNIGRCQCVLFSYWQEGTPIPLEWGELNKYHPYRTIPYRGMRKEEEMKPLISKKGRDRK
jgi:hypothetical protein